MEITLEWHPEEPSMIPCNLSVAALRIEGIVSYSALTGRILGEGILDFAAGASLNSWAGMQKSRRPRACLQRDLLCRYLGIQVRTYVVHIWYVPKALPKPRGVIG